MGAITRGIANNILGSGAVDGTDALSGTIPATNIANASLDNLTTFPPSVDAGIPQVAGDPPAPSDGDVWYNTNTYKLKVRGVSAPAGSWATGGSLNTARADLRGAGTQTSALMFAGIISTTRQAVTESYNGSSYTEVADLNTARSSLGGAGTDNTSALAFSGDLGGGSVSAATESWNGSTWTEVNDLNTGREQVGDFGTATAAICTGGNVPAETAATESWNGTSWTEVNDLNNARRILAGAGTSTSGLAFGGYNANPLAYTESWNGTTWTEVNDLNIAKYNMDAGGSSNTSAIIAGGYNVGSGTLANTEIWDGTSWTEVADLSTGRYGNGSAGTTIALVTSGGTPPVTGATEEFTGTTSNLNVDLA